MALRGCGTWWVGSRRVALGCFCSVVDLQIGAVGGVWGGRGHRPQKEVLKMGAALNWTVEIPLRDVVAGSV